MKVQCTPAYREAKSYLNTRGLRLLRREMRRLPRKLQRVIKEAITKSPNNPQQAVVEALKGMVGGSLEPMPVFKINRLANGKFEIVLPEQPA